MIGSKPYRYDKSGLNLHGCGVTIRRGNIMRFYLHLLKIIYMYMSTMIVTMAVLMWLAFYIENWISNRMPQDTPAVKCLEEGGTWDDQAEECKQAA